MSQSYTWNEATIRDNHVKRAYVYYNDMPPRTSQMDSGIVLVSFLFDKSGRIQNEKTFGKNYFEYHVANEELYYLYNDDGQLKLEITKNINSYGNEIDTTFHIDKNNYKFCYRRCDDNSGFCYFKLTLYNCDSVKQIEIVLQNMYSRKIVMNIFNKYQLDDSIYLEKYSIKSGNFNEDSIKYFLNNLSQSNLYNYLLKQFDKDVGNIQMEERYVMDKNNNIVSIYDNYKSESSYNRGYEYQLNENGLVEKEKVYGIDNNGEKILINAYCFRYSYW